MTDKANIDVRVLVNSVKDLLGYETDKELADELGITSGRLTTAISRNSLTFYDELIEFCLQKGININELFAALKNATERIKFGQNITTPPFSSEVPGPELKIWGSVGAGDRWDYNLQEVDPEQLKPKEIITISNLFQHHVRDAFRVKGFSMFPVLRPGALIGVDFNNKAITGSELYVFNFAHEGLTVKEAWPETKRTRLHSYRSEIPDFYLEGEELDEYTVVGRVVWIYTDTSKD